MTRQSLMYFNVPAQEVLRVASAIRRAGYDSGTDQQDSGMAMMSQIGEIARQLDLTWMGVPADSPFDGKTLGELRIRTTIGASVVGIIRAGSFVANPDGEERFERGDLVAVLGTRDQIARFEAALRPAALAAV